MHLPLHSYSDRPTHPEKLGIKKKTAAQAVIERARDRQEILQSYSGLDVPMCEVSPEQHRIPYFPEVSPDRNNLISDFKP